MPALRLAQLLRQTLLLGIAFRIFSASGADNPAVFKPKDLDTPRDFPAISSRQQWTARAQDIRDHVLVSCGLWPQPPRTPLDAHIFGKTDRGDYSVEKVYLQTYPGFYLAGNLYRPLGKGRGPFPAVLNPHGHWANGRMADEKDGSIAARCISFARMGMIAFSYDMVGYNDTHFADPQSTNAQYNVHRQFGTNQTDVLWSISLMGLQTWNSIRALDFLQSLPDADPKRLACTGESGGGTQTFMLGAVEDRLALQAPIVMVSHIMQGGCSCENAPGLRVQFSNMEIAARPAPRPQILVAASGDWTRDTMTVEGPSIAHIYELFGAPEKFRYTRFDFPHNYNQTTRQTVYGWFNKWLLHASTYAPLKEQPYKKEPDAELRVFPDGKLPSGALTREEFVASLKRLHQQQMASLQPHNKGALKSFRQKMEPAWRHTLQIELDLVATVTQPGSVRNSTEGGVEFASSMVTVSRTNEPNAITCSYWVPKGFQQQPSPRLAILADSAKSQQVDGRVEPEKPTELALNLLKRGVAVLQVDRFSSVEPENEFANFYCTYNRTTLQSRVRDLVTLCSAAKALEPKATHALKTTLVGQGKAGLWCLMAAPAASAIIADCDTLDFTNEQALLDHDLFCPGLLALDAFRTAALLAAPNPLLLHNTGNGTCASLRDTYAAVGAGKLCRAESTRVPDGTLAEWVVNQQR